MDDKTRSQMWAEYMPSLSAIEQSALNSHLTKTQRIFFRDDQLGKPITLAGRKIAFDFLA